MCSHVLYFTFDTSINCLQDPNCKSTLIDMKSNGPLKKPSQNSSDLLLNKETYIRDNEERIFLSAFLPVVTTELIRKHNIERNTSTFGRSV